MNCESLNDIFHSLCGRIVYCDIDSNYRLIGYGLIQIDKKDVSFYFGVHFENGIASGMGFMCKSTDLYQIVGIQFENDCIVSVNDKFITEEAIIDEDSGRRWEGLVNENHVACGFGRFYNDNGDIEYEGLCWQGQRCGFGVSYHLNGSTASFSFYVFNKKFGNSKDYDVLGRHFRNGLYCNDKLCVSWGADQNFSEREITAYCSSTSLVDDITISDLSLIHSSLPLLRKVTICEKSTPKVPQLVVRRLPFLSQIHFLSNACSHYTADYPPYLHVPEIRDTSKTLVIEDCPSLLTIRFDSFACSDFTSLRIDLPSLEECIFGEEESYCFYAATSLFLRSPKLRVLRFGEFSFYWTEEVRIQSTYLLKRGEV